MDEITKLETTYNENIVILLDKIRSDALFIYLIIFITALLISSYLEISITTIFLLFVGFLICYYIYSKRKLDKINEKEQMEIKKKLIFPIPEHLGYDHPELTEIMFEVRQYYYINPNGFTNVINNIDKFLELYNQVVNISVPYCKDNIDVAETLSRTILNDFQSIIYKLPTDYNLTMKLRYAMKEIHVVLFQYLERMKEVCKKEMKERPITTETRYIESSVNPKGSNYFDVNNTDKYYNFY